MGEHTEISWATHTFNPWVGCTKLKVHDIPSACDFCYAEGWAKRSGMVKWGDNPRVRTSPANWKKPLQWARKARDERVDYRFSERPRVFCASLADVFDNQAPQEWRNDLWDLIEMTPELDWMLLTKRPQNILKMIPERWLPAMPRQIWLGITAENQTEYERRMDALQKTRAAVHFVSYEPALGPLTIGHRLLPDMIICGGEDKARPGRPTSEEVLNYSRAIRDECRQVGVSFYFKQTVGKGEIPPDLMIRQFPPHHRRLP